MPLDVEVGPKYGKNMEAEVRIQDTEHPEQEARFAMALIEKWGLVMGKPDGEDSAGRQKLSEMSSEEIVDKACEISEKSFAAFRKRGWMVTIPTFREAEELLKVRENGQETEGVPPNNKKGSIFSRDKKDTH